MDATEYGDWLRSTRRELHRRPEPAWREFYTTARIVEQLRDLDVDDIQVGPEILAEGERGGVPDQAELERWLDQARGYDVDDDLLDRLAGGYTGAIATLDRGEGPTIALRVDIDGLPRRESGDNEHTPAAEGFRSEHEGYMHACGHDAHATFGLGVLRAVADSEFQGRLKVIFQPAEEVIGGADRSQRAVTSTTWTPCSRSTSDSTTLPGWWSEVSTTFWRSLTSRRSSTARGPRRRQPQPRAQRGAGDGDGSAESLRHRAPRGRRDAGQRG
jgi:Metal-dependent amidase/aminoacylase/carboxypeptidase